MNCYEKTSVLFVYQCYKIFHHFYVWLSSSELFSQLTISLSPSRSSWISSLCLTIICKKREKSAEKSGGLEARFVLLTNQTYTHDVVMIESSFMVNVQTTQFLGCSIWPQDWPSSHLITWQAYIWTPWFHIGSFCNISQQRIFAWAGRVICGWFLLKGWVMGCKFLWFLSAQLQAQPIISLQTENSR